jgi:hypothetical protein
MHVEIDPGNLTPPRTPPPNRSPNSWQLHSYFSPAKTKVANSSDDNFDLRYGLLNYIKADEVQKIVIIPVGVDISFKCLLEIANLLEYRIKKLCTFVANLLTEQASDFSKDFPDAVCDEKAVESEPKFLARYAAIVSNVSAALRSEHDIAAVAGDGVISLISAVLLPRGLKVLKEQDMLVLLQSEAAAEGFVFAQRQAINKKIVLELLIGTNASFFLMTRSTPPSDLIYDMLKLCSKAKEKANAASSAVSGSSSPVNCKAGGHGALSVPSPSVSPLNKRRYGTPKKYLSKEKNIKYMNKENVFFGDIMKNRGFERPSKLALPEFPVDVYKESVDVVRAGIEKMQSTSPKLAKGFTGSIISVLLLVITTVVVLLVIYGLMKTPTEASSGYLYFEVVALSSVVPALLCFKFFFATRVDGCA